MKVYRIENTEGHGPWTSGGIGAAWVKLAPRYGYRWNPSDMPGIWDTSERSHKDHLTQDPKARFAFPSVGAMRRWFKPAMLRELAKSGHTLAVYEVSKAVVTDAQVTYRPHRAKLVERRALA